MRAQVIILIVILSSCNTIKEGEVISKGIEPERDYLYMMPIPHTNRVGKVTTTFYTYIPVYMHDDEDYYIIIRGKNNANEDAEETLYVNRNQFNCLSVGDHFVVNKDCSLSANEDQRK